MVNNRNFALSAELFSHFKTQVDIDETDSLEEIIVIVVEKLRSILKKHNLVELSDKLDLCNFHTHDYTFEDVLLSNPEKEFYICDHQH